MKVVLSGLEYIFNDEGELADILDEFCNDTNETTQDDGIYREYLE